MHIVEVFGRILLSALFLIAEESKGRPFYSGLIIHLFNPKWAIKR